MSTRDRDLRQRVSIGGLGVASVVLGVIVLFNARLDPSTLDSYPLRSSEMTTPLPSFFSGNSDAPIATRDTDAGIGAQPGFPSPGTGAFAGSARRRASPDDRGASEVFAPARFLGTPTPEAFPAAREPVLIVTPRESRRVPDQ